ncbi:MAG: hypothetical protein Q7K39_03845 [Candidatus Magasanikbacteria bacterium]|nr:hypothetical protein [Candidatus Magasanikbacteria bacterium]
MFTLPTKPLAVKRSGVDKRTRMYFTHNPVILSVAKDLSVLYFGELT